MQQPNLQEIIQSINTTNRQTIFQTTGFTAVQEYLTNFHRLTPISYIDHGSTSICFVLNGQSKVLKVFKKASNLASNVLRSSAIFVDYQKKLQMARIPIVPISILYEDSNYIVALQERVVIPSAVYQNTRFVLDILTIIEQMLARRIRLHDVFYRNFGYLRNKICVFDFNESIDFHDNIDLFVANLFQLFYLYYSNQFYENVPNPSIDVIRTNGYPLPSPHLSQFMRQVHSFEIEDALHTLRFSILPVLKAALAVNHCIYQQFEIDACGGIHLRSHTRQKAEILARFVDIAAPVSILDAGCSYGAIGITVAKRHPEIAITLNNLDRQEITASVGLAQSQACYNIAYSNEDVRYIPAAKQYDMVVCYALVHHLLKYWTLEECLRHIIGMARKIVIIEFPVFPDILLKEVMGAASSEKSSNFSALQSCESVREVLEKVATVIEVVPMVYGDHQGICRYTFVLSVGD